MLLGHSWIHANMVLPSTFHQYMKYCDHQGIVHTLIADKQPFKGVRNYFTDAILCKDIAEASTGIARGVEGDYDSDNEADTESKQINEEDFELK